MAATSSSNIAVLGEISVLPVQQKLGLILGFAAVIAICAGAWLWSQTPDYRVLFSNLTDRDGGAIVSALTQLNVPYKFAEGGGAILVPADRVHEARLHLASQGLPKGGLVGFELMEGQKLGTSQFAEQINYQRALEGELARSIQSLSAVQGARVHLAIPKPSVFMREEAKPSASVLLNVFPGKQLEPSQVSGIAHLISSSVAHLTVANVTIVDQSGKMLNASTDAQGVELDPTQLKYVQDLEENYSRRVEGILAPIVGAENVHSQVTAEVDFTQSEQTAETYSPNKGGADGTVRSQQLTESAQPAGGGAVGVPGALSNQPPVPATVAGPNQTSPPAAAGAPAAGANGAAPAPAAPTPLSTHKESTVNYEIDKTIRHVRSQVGNIKRVSVAVVVNQKKGQDADGKTIFTPLTEAEMTQINDLVREAVGFNKERGDTLSIANTPFNTVEREAVPEMPFWKEPGTINLAKDIGKYLLIALGALYLVLGVLRPLLKSLATPARPVQELLTGDDADVHVSPNAAALGYEQNLQAAKQIAKGDPKLVANVVKGWVSGNA
jgi:flagellar M-ring protein FliF